MTDFSLATLAPALPEVVLSLLVFALLVIDATLHERDRAITYWLSLVALVGTAVFTAGTMGAQGTVTLGGLSV